MTKDEMLEFARNEYMEYADMEPDLILIDVYGTPYGMCQVDEYWIEGVDRQEHNVKVFIDNE